MHWDVRKDRPFREKLIKAVVDIRCEAAGRVCGTCIHFGDQCALWSSPWYALYIMGPGAVACRQHTLKS